MLLAGGSGLVFCLSHTPYRLPVAVVYRVFQGGPAWCLWGVLVFRWSDVFWAPVRVSVCWRFFQGMVPCGSVLVPSGPYPLPLTL